MNRLYLGIAIVVAALTVAATLTWGILGLAVSSVVILVLAWWLGVFKNLRTETKKSKLTIHDIVRVATLVGLTFLALLASPVVGIAFGALIAILFALLWVLPYVPGLVQALANDPNEFRPQVETTPAMSRVEKAKLEASVAPYEESTFALFTFIKPGRVKAIIRGERFMRFIMRFDGMTFVGDVKRGTGDEIPMNRREYWDVKVTEENQDDSHPIPRSLRKGKFDLLWLWSRHVYDLTGAVFTGIPPFQTVEVYELEQLIKVLSSQEGDEGEFVLIPRKDYSDHVRAAEFQFFVQVPSAETKDQVKVRLQFALTVMITNPYRAFYDTDNRWASRLFTAVANEVSSTVRALPYKEVIAADKNTKTARNPLLKPILRLNPDATGTGARAAAHHIGQIGLYIKEAELLDAEVADPNLADALADVAKSKADKEARQNRADAETYAVDNIAAAARRHGEYGRLALMVEGNVRTAAAATEDGGDVILNIDSARGEQVDPRTAFLRKSINGGSE
tara:strand:- start:259 stop:1779 length:1521 start_codon:yes stop_codon:yes gene_type:complete